MCSVLPRCHAYNQSNRHDRAGMKIPQLLTSERVPVVFSQSVIELSLKAGRKEGVQ